jgi:acyl-coenzyme A thioesterase PaaI-like protein
MSETRLTAMPGDFEPPVPYDRCFDAVYGLQIVEDDQEGGAVRARIDVRPEVCDHEGALAGGVVAAAGHDGRLAQGLSNDTTMFGRVGHGHAEAVARVVGRTDSEWVWSVEFTDAAGTPCALARVTVAVRTPR